MSQNLTVAFNAIVSDTTSGTRRNIFNGSNGWVASSGINYGQYQCTSSAISIGACTQGIALSSDLPVDITFVQNGTTISFLAQTIFMMSGTLTGITLNLSPGSTGPSTTNVALVS